MWNCYLNGKWVREFDTEKEAVSWCQNYLKRGGKEKVSYNWCPWRF